MKKKKESVSKKTKENNSSEFAGKIKFSLAGASFFTIISSALISLVVGAIGCLLVVPYFINSQADSEVKVSDYNWGNASLVIRDPKKVVVNQDLKIEESLNSVSTSMVKFYPALNASSSDSLDKKLDAGKYYLLKEPFASGVIMSTDGWVFALWPVSGKAVDLKKVVGDFEALSYEGKVYRADQAILTEKITKESEQLGVTPILIHLASVNNLPVRNLVKPADLKVGQSLFSYDGGRGVGFGFLADRQKSNLLRSSEDFSESLAVDFSSASSTKPSFIFNLAGDLLAWQTPSGKVSPIYSLNARLNSLFKLRRFSEPFFGVNYYNLSDLWSPGFNRNKGALVYSSGKKEAVIKGGPAEKAGLKEGDLILDINGEVVNATNDLSSIIQNYLPGQELLISYSRSGVNAETSVKLSELK